jgi:hypothetical protein
MVERFWRRGVSRAATSVMVFGGRGDGRGGSFNSKKGAYYYDDPAHVHAVTAISKSLRFEWNLTSCFTGPQTITFKINGHVALTTNATDASCSCQPGSRGNVTVTDPAVLAYLKNGPNTFTVSYPEYLSWALVNLGTQGDVLIYDPYGNAAGRPTDLCGAGYNYGLPEQTKQANVALETYAYDEN